MSTGFSPEDPFGAEFEESEQVSDSQGDAQSDEAAEDSVTSSAARQRASAAAAYGKAIHNAPRKHGERGQAADADASAEPPQGSSDVASSEPQAEVDDVAARAERADEYLALAQRTKADFENYRKRAARDAALAQDRGIAKLAKELLPAVDNLERAVHHAGQAYGSAGRAGADPDPAEADAGAGGDTQMIDGLKLVHAELLAALGRAGIEPFSPIGEQFDPQHHEAVAQHHIEGAVTGTVLEVYQQGYRLGETVLRPARVLVAA